MVLYNLGCKNFIVSGLKKMGKGIHIIGFEERSIGIIQTLR